MQHGLVRIWATAAIFVVAACGGAEQSTRDAGSRTSEEQQAAGAPAAQETPAVPGSSAGLEAGGGLPSGGATPAGASRVGEGGADGLPLRPAAGPGIPDQGSTPEADPAPGGTSANDVLARAEQTYSQLRSMRAEFSQEVYVPLLETTQYSRGTLFHRSPDRFLMRFSQPEGDIVVADGRYIWMYYPSTDERQVMRAPLAPGGQQVDLHREFLSDATSRYNATRTGSETVAGRQAHALTLIPRGQSPYTRVRIWVDERDNLVRRFEITEQNGSVRKLEMTNLQPNVAIADDVFRFTPPAGTEVHDF